LGDRRCGSLTIHGRAFAGLWTWLKLALRSSPAFRADGLGADLMTAGPLAVGRSS
jgi:hypothetical protein